MKPVDFPQRNLLLAEDQEQYTTLPVQAEYKQVNHPGGLKTVPWSMTSVHELSEEEIQDLIRTRKLYYRQYLFGGQFQPMFISTKSPFEEEGKAHWPADI